MSRATPEWIGKTDDSRIPARVRARIFDRQKGRCAICERKIMTGERWEADHTQAIINGGENRESNLRALCPNCHKAKTREDVAEKAKVARVRKKHLGLHQPKSPLPGSRGSKWKKRIDGTVVPRD